MNDDVDLSDLFPLVEIDKLWLVWTVVWFK